MKEQSKVLVAYILLGFGIGVLFSSFINILYPTVKLNSYTDEEIKQKARTLGMIEFDKENIELEGSGNGMQEKKTTKQQNPRMIQFEIKKGQRSQEIIDTLLNKGLIKDKEGFSELIKQRRLEKKFNYGDYSVPVDIGADELLDRLTNK